MDNSADKYRLIDDFSHATQARNGQRWEYVSDNVMGGVSRGEACHKTVQGVHALQLEGSVSLENNGGFIQVALNLGNDGAFIDARDYTGISVCVCGDGGRYAMNLRTSDTQRPWQSYRCPFVAPQAWTDLYLPFSDFVAHRTSQALNIEELRRIGLIAIGDPGVARVALSRIAFYA